MIGIKVESNSVVFTQGSSMYLYDIVILFGNFQSMVVQILV